MKFKKFDTSKTREFLLQLRSVIHNTLQTAGVDPAEIVYHEGLFIGSYSCFSVRVGDKEIVVGLLNTNESSRGPRTKFEVSLSNVDFADCYEAQITLFYLKEAIGASVTDYGNNKSPMLEAVKAVLNAIIYEVDQLATDEAIKRAIHNFSQTFKDL